MAAQSAAHARVVARTLTEDPMAKIARPPALFTVYYDGGCKLCRTRIAIYKMEARRGEIAIAWRDVSEEPEALAEFGIGPEDARRRLHVVDADGTLLAGADAFALLWSALPGYRRLGRLVASPGFNSLAHAVYDSGLAHAFHRLRKSFRERTRGRERDGDTRGRNPEPAAEGRTR
jgi:predicted DCC family thiol-disulfide oxidoreductase YuxK